MICGLQAYRRITRDRESFDGDVLDALVAAQKIVQRRTDRFFERGTYTETLLTHPDGRVYPRGLPLVSVSSPANVKVEGAAIFGGVSIFNDVLINWQGLQSNPPLQVTYVGGYLPEDMPEEIVQVVAEIAYISTTSMHLVDVPTGVTSVSVGDVSYTGKSELGKAGLPERIKSVLRDWRRREL